MDMAPPLWNGESYQYDEVGCCSILTSVGISSGARAYHRDQAEGVETIQAAARSPTGSCAKCIHPNAPSKINSLESKI
jgi:hypothetical protein